MLAAGAAARLFGGGLREIGVAGLSSLAIGVLDQLTDRSPRAARVLEPVAALLASALAVTAASVLGPLSVQVATLSGLIVLLPGLGLTVAINELASRHLISGASRLTAAALVFLQLIFGVALGQRLAEVLPLPPMASPPAPLPFWTVVVALVVVALAVNVLFRARPADIGWIVAAGALAFGGARFGARGLGAELGAFVGALLLGMASNAAARVRNRPSVVTIVPGMMLLVPGSLGLPQPGVPAGAGRRGRRGHGLLHAAGGGGHRRGPALRQRPGALAPRALKAAGLGAGVTGSSPPPRLASPCAPLR